MSNRIVINNALARSIKNKLFCIWFVSQIIFINNFITKGWTAIEETSDNNDHNNETSVLRNNSVQRINFQRDFIKQSLNFFSPDDFILHSDNDEIPNMNKFDIGVLHPC